MTNYPDDQTVNRVSRVVSGLTFTSVLSITLTLSDAPKGFFKLINLNVFSTSSLG